MLLTETYFKANDGWTVTHLLRGAREWRPRWLPRVASCSSAPHIRGCCGVPLSGPHGALRRPVSSSRLSLSSSIGLPAAPTGCTRSCQPAPLQPDADGNVIAFRVLDNDARNVDDGAGSRVVATTKVGRNDPCPCGSGRKFKHCCEGKNPRADSLAGLVQEFPRPRGAQVTGAIPGGEETL